MPQFVTRPSATAETFRVDTNFSESTGTDREDVGGSADAIFRYVEKATLYRPHLEEIARTRDPAVRARFIESLRRLDERTGNGP
jgi:hypothetical protein